MKTKEGKIIQTRIRLPEQIVNSLSDEAAMYGFSLKEWINYILIATLSKD